MNAIIFHIRYIFLCFTMNIYYNILRKIMITFSLKSLYNTFFGTKVGSDEFGNKYYIEKFTKKNKRWVMFGIKNDTSYIPARWYGWINFMHDDVIKKKKIFLAKTTHAKFIRHKIRNKTT